MQITVINKRTNERLVLSLEEFKEKFKTEFVRAYQSYVRHETAKTAMFPAFMQKSHTEADFMISFAWNFNNYANSEWYIRAIL